MSLQKTPICESRHLSSDTTQTKSASVDSNTYDKSLHKPVKLHINLSTTIAPSYAKPKGYEYSSAQIQYSTMLDEMRSLTSANKKDDFGIVKLISLNEAVEKIRLHIEELDAERIRWLEIEDNDPCCL